ncbi:alpha/beta hydrolase-fold protein [Pedobacter sp. MC2016-15]|uniref:alpha/beta fold hydrolase n=1 Tax=Pedobacter sp. MC2016-15 TaxID=2994473 RepID=UPI002247FD6A|nr:alpha/beta fold hydrolase [Pedobacter sp. MC2016-15]MCX2481625.1 alpha/beta hydrolase-fold protein [Pedobacter sp. MC2016-15]
MNKILALLISLGICQTLSAQQIKLDDKNKFSIYSKSESLERTFYIQLPKDYVKVNKKYPLIVLFDAQDQTLYNYTSSTIDRLIWTNDIPEAIFVGVFQHDRSKELNVEKNEASSVQFLNFIKNELINLLCSKYRLNGFYTLIGHSLGGQFVTNAMLTYPGTFRSVISISGALNYPNKDNVVKSRVINKINNFIAQTPDSLFLRQKYYFSTGDDGFQDSGFLLGALKVDSLFKAKKPKSKNWRFDLINGANHMTTPLMSIPSGLTFVYHDWHFSDSLAMDILLYHRNDPLNVLKSKKRDIIKSYGTDILLPYNSYYQFADYYLSNAKTIEAEELARQLIDIYPNDDEPYNLMADIQRKKGDIQNAIKFLKKAQSKSTVDKYTQKIRELQNE